MTYGGRQVRAELLWEHHVATAPDWLAPYLIVPADASPPLLMTPVHPEAVGSYGPEAIEWMQEALGHPLRWWQALAVVRQLEHREDGSLCWETILESGSRRIGKSVRLRSMALWRLVNADMFGEPQLVIHTGKDLAIVREIISKAWRWAEAREWRVVKAIGRETIENEDHRWYARSVEGVYGYDTTFGMVDEGWDVDPPVVTEGMEPAILERRSPQIGLTSTAHRKATSLMRTKISDAMAADDGQTLLLLWSVLDGSDSGDPATWRAASAHWSPAREKLMANKFEKASRGETDPELDDPDPLAGFEAQYLNRWRLKAGAAGAFPEWDGLRSDDEPPPVEALGVAADRDVTWFALASAGCGWVSPVDRMRAEGNRAAFVALVAAESERLGGVPVSLALKGSAGFLRADLEDAGCYVVTSTPEEFIQASADFADAVEREADRLRHGGSPDLAAEVQRSSWRRNGKRRELDVLGVAVPMLEAVVLAHHTASEPLPDLMNTFLE